MTRAQLHTLLLLMGGFVAYKLSILLAWNGDALTGPTWDALQPACFVALFCTWGIVSAATLLAALAVFARRRLAWSSVMRLLPPGFALALGGALAFLSLVFSNASLSLVVAAAAVMSTGYALLHFVWAILALRANLLTVLAALTVGQLITSGAFMALKQAGTEVQASFLIASCAILFVTVYALASREGASAAPFADRHRRTRPQRDPLVIGIAASTLGVGILWGSSPSLRDYTLWVFGAIAVCATFFAVSLIQKREANAEALIRLVFAMLGIAILLNAVAPDWHAVFMGAVWMGYSMLSLCLFLLGRNDAEGHARPNGKQLIVALALFDACIALGLVMGRIMSVAVPSIETPTTVAVALLLAFIFLFGNRSTARQAPPSEQHPADLDDVNEAIRSQCQAFAVRHELTDAECDTLFYLVKGLTIKRIAEARYVSLNTIKSQMTSIYRKAGVHSKQDLLGMFETEHPDCG